MTSLFVKLTAASTHKLVHSGPVVGLMSVTPDTRVASSSGYLAMVKGVHLPMAGFHS